jgi:hypothetical protein
MLQIGKTTLRENQPLVPSEYLLQSTLFPLVTPEVVAPKSQDQMVSQSNKLIRQMLDQATLTFNKISNDLMVFTNVQTMQTDVQVNSSSVQNHYLVKLDEIHL